MNVEQGRVVHRQTYYLLSLGSNIYHGSDFHWDISQTRLSYKYNLPDTQSCQVACILQKIYPQLALSPIEHRSHTPQFQSATAHNSQQYRAQVTDPSWRVWFATWAHHIWHIYWVATDSKSASSPFSLPPLLLNYDACNQHLSTLHTNTLLSLSSTA